MFDPFALWKALRRFSLTFAIVFASALLGLSITALFSRLLASLGFPWWILWLVPMVVIAMLAKREAIWMPDEHLRRRVSKRIVVGALTIWIGLFAVRLWFGDEPAPSKSPAPSARGPR